MLNKYSLRTSSHIVISSLLDPFTVTYMTPIWYSYVYNVRSEWMRGVLDAVEQ